MFRKLFQGYSIWNYDIQQLVSRLQVSSRLLEKMIYNQEFVKTWNFNVARCWDHYFKTPNFGSPECFLKGLPRVIKNWFEFSIFLFWLLITKKLFIQCINMMLNSPCSYPFKNLQSEDISGHLSLARNNSAVASKRRYASAQTPVQVNYG